MDAKADPDEPAPGSAHQTTLGDDLRQLIDDGRTLAEAELAWQKSRAAYAGKQVGEIAVLGLLAGAFVLLALLALTVGLLLGLTPRLGVWGATGAVTGGLLVAALIAGALAALRVRRVARLIADRKARR